LILEVLRKTGNVIDSISYWTARTGRWLSFLIVMVMVYEVTMRYVFNAPTTWVYDTVTMMGATLYCCSWAYATKNHRHIRVDVLSSRFPPRARVLVQVLGDTCLFFPLFILFARICFIRLLYSWATNEIVWNGVFHPPLAPVRTVFFLGMTLHLVQGVVEFIRYIPVALRGGDYYA